MSALLSALAMLLCAALLAVLLRGQQRPELAMCLSLAAGVVVLLLLLRQVTPLLDTLRQMLTAGSFPAPYLTVVVKATGVCLLTQLTADTCRDAGETALAGKAELAGRFVLLALAVPLFVDVLELVTALINGQAVSG